MADPRSLTRRRALAQKSFVKKRRASMGMMGRGYIPGADSLHDDGSFSPMPLRGESRAFRIRQGDDERRIPNPTRSSTPRTGRATKPAAKRIGLKPASRPRPVARRTSPGRTPSQAGRPKGGRSTGLRRR